MTIDQKFAGLFASKDLKNLQFWLGRAREPVFSFGELQEQLARKYVEFDGSDEDGGALALNAKSYDDVKNFVLKGGIQKSHTRRTREELFFEQCCRHSLGETIAAIALKVTLESGDVELLARALEQWVRLSYASFSLHECPDDMAPFLLIENSDMVARRWGRYMIADHSRFRECVIRAYACGRADLARRFWRKNMGLIQDKDVYAGAVSSNLIICTLYPKESGWSAQTMEILAQYRKQTKSKYDLAFVNFLAAVQSQDLAAATENLNTLAERMYRLDEYSQNWEKRIFNSRLHGLYAFACAHLGGQMRRPDVSWFWGELDDIIRNRAADFVPAMKFEGDLEFLNDVALLMDREAN